MTSAIRRALQMVALMYGFQIGLIKSVLGGWSEQWFNTWRDLHCRTNGFVTDYIAGWIRLVRPRPAFRPVHGVLGTLDNEVLHKIISALNRDGLYVMPAQLNGKAIAALTHFAMRTPAMPYPQVEGVPAECLFSSAHPLAPTYWHKWLNTVQDETVQALMCDPSVIAIAAQYLKVDPVLVSVNLWHSTPFSSEPSAEAAQKYHFDLSYPSWVNLFIYLTDVGPQNGPHCFIRGSHKRDRIGQGLRKRGIQRIPDADVESAYGLNSLEEICGPAGTLFFADTRAFHKGKMPTKGNRLVFELVFASSQVTYQVPQRSFDAINSEAVRAISSDYPRYFQLFQPQA